MTTQYVIQFKRKPSATWTASNPILSRGEPGFELDTFKLKIGDGITAWNSLPYQNGLGVSGSLETLTDVSITDLATGDVLVYDGVTGKWVNNAGIGMDIEDLGTRVTNLESIIPPGSIQAWSMPYNPAGWIACNGSSVSRTAYPDLFNAIVPALDTVTFGGDEYGSSAIYTTPYQNRLIKMLRIGDPVYFTTTGTLPTGISPNTIYYVNGGGAFYEYVQLATTRTATLNGWTVSNPLGIVQGSDTGVHTMYYAPYGIGDGSTTFNLPDFRGRTLIGVGTSEEFDIVNKRGGEKAHLLTSNEMPSHTHTGITNANEGSHKHWISGAAYDDGNMSTSGSSNSQDYGLAADAGSWTLDDPNKNYGRYSSTTGSLHQHNFTTNATGGLAGVTQSHNILQPYTVVNYVIKI